MKGAFLFRLWLRLRARLNIAVPPANSADALQESFGIRFGDQVYGSLAKSSSAPLKGTECGVRHRPDERQ